MASASRWSTRCRRASRSRSRAGRRSIARPSSAACPSPSSKWSARRPTGAARKVRFQPDEQIFGKAARFDPARLFKMTRAKAYLFGGVEIRWRCAPSLLDAEGQEPRRGGVPLPRRPQGLSRRRHRGPGAGRRPAVHRQGRERRQTRLGRMGGRLARGRGRLRPFLLQHHPDARRRHATRRACASRCCAG